MGAHRKWSVIAVAIAAILAGGCAPSPPDDATSRACEVERRTIATALEASRAEDAEGEYPESLEELLGSFIKPGSIRFDWLYGSDGPTYSLFGPC